MQEQNQNTKAKQHFENVNTQIRFPEIERGVLDVWEKEKTFAASLESTKDKNDFVFYDGPPFATGLPHYGHLLAGTLKDIVPRYWTMRGYHVERRFGWDCHGLPVENEMEKEFKVSGKRDIEKLGIHLFNEACRSIVLRYTGEWEKVVTRMGRWVDFVNQYRTMDAPFMESIWWVFKQIWNSDLIYRGFRVQPYCPRCTTPLSNFEVNEGYKEISGPSITVAFPIVKCGGAGGANDSANDSVNNLANDNAKILVWTTTPWTLPSNVALAVGEKIVYVKFRDGDNVYIMAKERLSAYYKDMSAIEILGEMTGAELAAAELKYEPMFDFFKERDNKFFSVTCADFVSTEDGTGIVHIAPAFGEDDFQVGQKLELPIVCPVDDEGKFTDEVAQEWRGKLVYTVDDDITKNIKERGRLYHKTKVVHRYPHCYRCDTALIYKAIKTWFLKIAPLKENMLANNQQIHWVPSHLQNGRFGKGIESAPDWNISRNRYWGTPIPVWLCECGHTECVGSVDELHALVGDGDKSRGKKMHAQVAKNVEASLKTDDVKARLAAAKIDNIWAERLSSITISDVDIHRHIIDELEVKCPKCKSQMTRTTEVLDCWFESGSMPYAQQHYPFENKEKFDANFPADFIAEGLDQTRGWFYTLTVLSAALFKKPAFKNVIVNGIILAEDGKKLSKRLRNYAPPEDVLNQLGADALRLFLINSPAVKAEDLRFSEKGVMEMSRAVLLPFWNAYAFFVTYANVDGWKPSDKIFEMFNMPDNIDKSDKSDNGASEFFKNATELDRWIISLLNDVIASVNKEMEQYNLYRVVPHLVDFIDNLTNWYIRRSRRRFWKSENDGDKDVAYNTLYYVLVEFSKVMAPFLPFVTEAIYKNLVCGKIGGAPASVHLCDYPQAQASAIDVALETKMRLVRQAVAMGRALRSRFTIKTRQPLSEFSIIVADRKKLDLIADMEDLVRDELNVKRVIFDSQEERVVSISAKANFKKLGKLFGAKMKDASALIENFSADDIKNLERGNTIDVLGTPIKYEDIEIRRAKREGFEVETEGELTVGLEVTITPELKKECVAREFVNRVQNRRKDTGLNVTDRIVITVSCPQEIKIALDDFREYVCSETLAVDVVFADSVSGGEAVEVEGVEVVINVEKR